MNKKELYLQQFIAGLPKAELHLHIEGSFEPELMFQIAQRNGIALKYRSIEELKAAYRFTRLQDFLDIYYAGAKVLVTQEDFYDLTMAYLKKAREQNIVHTEIFFDPQTHTERGVPFSTVIRGIDQALQDAKAQWGLSSGLILCILRHLDEESAISTLNEALQYRELFMGLGLDSSEQGHPPSKFQKVFAMARGNGLKLVVHAGEEGPPQYVWEALDLLGVDRIDHGNRSLEDRALVETLRNRKIPLTVCPLSNLKLALVKDMSRHPLKTMLEEGLFATINSDDPAYFGGYVNENFTALATALSLDQKQLALLARNSIEAAFLSREEKEGFLRKINAYVTAQGLADNKD